MKIRFHRHTASGPMEDLVIEGSPKSFLLTFNHPDYLPVSTWDREVWTKEKRVLVHLRPESEGVTKLAVEALGTEAELAQLVDELERLFAKYS